MSPLDVKCPQCLVPPGSPCSSTVTPVTVGDYGPEFHEARCRHLWSETRDSAPAPVTTRDSAPATPQRNTRVLATRERLPEERTSRTRVFRLQYEHKDGTPDTMHFYFTPGEYPDGRVGEVFVKADKVGSLASGLMDTIGVLLSLLLQYGVPLETVTSKLKNTRFSPSGYTRDKEIPLCTSPMDLLAKFLELRYLPKEKTDG